MAGWSKGRKLSEEHKRAISIAMKRYARIHPEAYPKGENHPNWKGGRELQHGYVYLHSPNHPRRTQRGYVKEHTLIAEKALGRYMKKGECVHHINGVKTDNRNCNLLICTISYHRWLENRMSSLYKKEHFK